MTRIEQRKLERYPLRKKANARLALRVGTVRHDIGEIRDISDSGISFRLDSAVVPSAQVAIEYADPNLQIEVYGRVAWCLHAPAVEPQLPSADQYILGIELLNPSMLHAMLQR